MNPEVNTMKTVNNAHRKIGLSLAFTGLLLSGCDASVESLPAVESENAVVTADVPEAPVVAQPVLPVSLNAVMVDLIDPASHPIWDAAATAPADDNAWTDLEHYANQLALSGYLITIAGTGAADAMWVQQPEWKLYADQLRDAGMVAILAAQNKDLQGIMEVGDVIVRTCEGCHTQFKLDVPTEGILHLPVAE